MRPSDMLRRDGVARVSQRPVASHGVGRCQGVVGCARRRHPLTSGSPISSCTFTPFNRRFSRCGPTATSAACSVARRSLRPWRRCVTGRGRITRRHTPTLTGWPTLTSTRASRCPGPRRLLRAWAGRQDRPRWPRPASRSCSHSTYHRGQVNARLREIGAEPPLVDYIAWLWFDRPAPTGAERDVTPFAEPDVTPLDPRFIKLQREAGWYFTAVVSIGLLGASFALLGLRRWYWCLLIWVVGSALLGVVLLPLGRDRVSVQGLPRR